MGVLDRIKRIIIDWLMREKKPREEQPLCDFERIKFELRLADVLLVDGRNRVSEIIKMVTQSTWSHSALYIGRAHDITNPTLREKLLKHYDGPMDEQLIIESLLGYGTVIRPLEKYRDMHLRICRPKGILINDANAVIHFAINRLGTKYAVRYILDLARFLLPWSIFPKRWRSSLFEKNPGTPAEEICSSMLAEAFASVHFPVLPITREYHDENGKRIRFYQRNPRLFTPSDFDYSPFFEIIKYPLFDVGDARANYKYLPWSFETGPISSYKEIPPDNNDTQQKSA